MKPVSELSIDELTYELKENGFIPPPINANTRKVLERKLESFRSGKNSISADKSKASKATRKTRSSTKKSISIGRESSGSESASDSIVSTNSTVITRTHERPRITIPFEDSTASSQDDSDDDIIFEPIGPATNRSSTVSTALINDSLDSSSSFENVTPTLGTSNTILPFPLKISTQKSAFAAQVTSKNAQLTSNTAKSTPQRVVTAQLSPFSLTTAKNCTDDYSPATSFVGSVGVGSSGVLQRKEKMPDLSLGQVQDEDDDHTESVRFLSSSERYRFPHSMAYNRFSVKKRSSPLAAISNYGKNVWGYFSRPIGESTPCSNKDYYKYKKYGTDDSASFSTSQKYRPSGLTPKKLFNRIEFWPWIPFTFILFLLAMTVHYFLNSYPEAVKTGYSTALEYTYLSAGFLYSFALFPSFCVTVVLALVAGIFRLYKHFEHKKNESKNQLMKLVEDITDIIQDAEDGVPEPHVRDMLMPPTKRTQNDFTLWNKAADFINKEDSRVKTEPRLINGIECNVWSWSTSVGKQMWQGSAVHPSSANVPAQALAKCLKLRGLNFSGVSEEQQVRQALLNKIAPLVPSHIGFSNSMNESLVYMKMRNLDYAKKAFLALHSHWFNGSLITAKYIYEARYNERFPESK